MNYDILVLFNLSLHRGGNSHECGREKDIDRKLNEEVYSRESQNYVLNYIRAACPSLERFREEQKHTDNEKSGIYDGGRKCGYECCHKLFLLAVTFTADKLVKSRGNKACRSTLDKANSGCEEGIYVPKNISAGVKRGHTVYKHDNAKRKSKQGTASFAEHNTAHNYGYKRKGDRNHTCHGRNERADYLKYHNERNKKRELDGFKHLFL